MDRVCEAVAGVVLTACEKTPGPDDSKSLNELVAIMEPCHGLSKKYGGVFLAADWERKRVAGQIPEPDEGKKLREAVANVRLEILKTGKQKYPPEIASELSALGRSLSDPQLKFVARAFADRLEGKPWPNSERITETLEYLAVYDRNPIHPFQNVCASFPEKTHPAYSLDPRYPIWELGILLALSDPAYPPHRDKSGPDEAKFYFPPLAEKLGELLSKRDASGLRSFPLVSLLKGWVERETYPPSHTDFDDHQKTVSLLTETLVSHLVPQTAALFPVYEEGRRIGILHRKPSSPVLEAVLPHHSRGVEKVEVYVSTGAGAESVLGEMSPMFFGSARKAHFVLPPEGDRSSFRDRVNIRIAAPEYRAYYQGQIRRRDGLKERLFEQLWRSTGPKYSQFDRDGLRKGLVLLEDQHAIEFVKDLKQRGFTCSQGLFEAFPGKYIAQQLASREHPVDYVSTSSPYLVGGSIRVAVREQFCQKPGSPRQEVTVVSRPPGHAAPFAGNIQAMLRRPQAMDLEVPVLREALAARTHADRVLLVLAPANPSAPHTDEERIEALGRLHSNLSQQIELLPIVGSVQAGENGVKQRLDQANGALIDGLDFAGFKARMGTEPRDHSWYASLNSDEQYGMASLSQVQHYDEALLRNLSQHRGWPLNQKLAEKTSFKGNPEFEKLDEEDKELLADPSERNSFAQSNRQAAIRDFGSRAPRNWLLEAYRSRRLEALNPQGLFVQTTDSAKIARRDSGVSGAVADLARAHTRLSLDNPPPETRNEEMESEALEAYVLGKSGMEKWLGDPNLKKARKFFENQLANREGLPEALGALARTYDLETSTVDKLAAAIDAYPFLIHSLTNALEDRRKPFQHAERLANRLSKLSQSDDVPVALSAKRSMAMLGLRGPASNDGSQDLALESGYASHGDPKAIAALKGNAPLLLDAYVSASRTGREAALPLLRKALKQESVVDLTLAVKDDPVKHAELIFSLLSKSQTTNFPPALATFLAIGEHPAAVSTSGRQALRDYIRTKPEEPFHSVALLTLLRLEPQDREVQGWIREHQQESEHGRFAAAVADLYQQGVKQPHAFNTLRNLMDGYASGRSKLAGMSMSTSIALLEDADPVVRERMAEYLVSRASGRSGEPYREWLSQLGPTAYKAIRTRLMHERDITTRSSYLQTFMRMPRSTEWERAARSMMRYLEPNEFEALAANR